MFFFDNSIAGAQAKFIQAENDLITSKLNYENIIGNIDDPKSLDKKSILDYELSKSWNNSSQNRF